MEKSYNYETILAELNRRFAARPKGSDHITITMKEDKEILLLRPCLDNPDTEECPFSEHDWVLVTGEGVAATFGGTPEKVAMQIANYSKEKADYVKSLTGLWNLYNKHKDDTTPCGESSYYEYYSDWHKELFNHRPHGWCPPPIAPGYL